MLEYQALGYLLKNEVCIKLELRVVMALREHKGNGIS